MPAPDLQFIMERVGPGNTTEDFALFACRGAGRGCRRNKHRSHAKHCEDCVRAEPSETLEQLMARMKRGDG